MKNKVKYNLYNELLKLYKTYELNKEVYSPGIMKIIEGMQELGMSITLDDLTTIKIESQCTKLKLRGSYIRK